MQTSKNVDPLVQKDFILLVLTNGYWSFGRTSDRKIYIITYLKDLAEFSQMIFLSLARFFRGRVVQASTGAARPESVPADTWVQLLLGYLQADQCPSPKGFKLK